MIQIKVTDTALPMLRGAEKQMPYALALALTRVAGDVKYNQARSMRQSFVIRAPWVASPQRWVVTNARKTDYPNPKAIVALDHNAKFLGDFEDGGVRTMRQNPIAIPTKTLRPAFAGLVPRQLLPHNIGLTTYRDPTGKRIKAGPKQEFFRMRPALLDAKAAGAWERTGSGKGTTRGSDHLRFLWKFVSHVRIPKRLGFIDRARITVEREWPRIMREAFDEAMRGARR